MKTAGATTISRASRRYGIQGKGGVGYEDARGISVVVPPTYKLHWNA